MENHYDRFTIREQPLILYERIQSCKGRNFAIWIGLKMEREVKHLLIKPYHSLKLERYEDIENL
jgi:hypothetical protein